MAQYPKPPDTFLDFQKKFPRLADAWEMLADAGRQGPLNEADQRLVKLAIAVGAMREGAVHSAVRKALAAGVTPEAVGQVLTLAASTIGLPSSVAVYSWVRDLLDTPPRGGM